MSGRRTAEMREALRLVAGGIGVRPAARQAGVHWTSLHSAINADRAAGIVHTAGELSIETLERIKREMGNV